MENYLTAKEVAARLQLSEQTIRRYVMLKQIPFHKIVRAVRFKPSEIQQWVEDRKAGLEKSQETKNVVCLFDEAGGLV